MRKSFVVWVALLLCGCTPMMVSSKKAPSYTGTIRTLAISIAQPGEMREAEAFGVNAGAARERGGSAMSDLDRALTDRLAPYLSSKGIPSEMVSGATASPVRFSHRLVIAPSSTTSTCNYSRCQAKVHIRATLRDASRKAVVWTGAFDVWEASSFHKIDNETADKVGDLIWRAFQAENLVGVVK